jgi:hypothetical protein
VLPLLLEHRDGSGNTAFILSGILTTDSLLDLGSPGCQPDSFGILQVNVAFPCTPPHRLSGSAWQGGVAAPRRPGQIDVIRPIPPYA